MSSKGFEEAQTIDETPNLTGVNEKPLNPQVIVKKRVDINILKSRIQKKENLEYKKNLVIFSVILIAISAVGIFFSI